MAKHIFPFSKFSGCGNDFIIIDNRQLLFPSDNPSIVINACKRRTGIGADGLILLETSQLADYRMRIFNADGSEAEMCGNGLRCFGRFLSQLGIQGTVFNVEVTKKLYEVALNQDLSVTIALEAPQEINWGIELESLQLDYMDTGVPHVVLFVEELDQVDVETLGSQIRHHPQFAPRGTNVNFVKFHNNEIHIRTYECGVEAETLACGTGMAAAAVAANKHYTLEGDTIIYPRSGDRVKTQLKSNKILQTGPAQCLYTGVLNSKLLLNLSHNSSTLTNK